MLVWLIYSITPLVSVSCGSTLQRNTPEMARTPRGSVINSLSKEKHPGKLTILHDDAIAEMEEKWQATLQATLRNILLRFPNVILTTLHSKRKNIAAYLNGQRTGSIIVIARCKTTLTWPREWYENWKPQVVDLEPCSLLNPLNRIPLRWAIDTPWCFSSALEGWVQEWQYGTGEKQPKLQGNTCENFEEISVFLSPEEAGKLYLNGKHLNVGTLPPVMFKREHSNGSLSFYGPLLELLHVYVQHLNFTYTIKYPPSGRGTGKLIQMSRQGELDMLLLLIFMGAKSQPKHPTSGLYFGEFGILIPPPREEHNLLSSAKPFRHELWIAIIGGMVLVALVIWKLSPKPQNYSSYGTSLLHVLGTGLNQGGSYSSKISTKMVITGWCLALVVLVNTYSSLLISIITVPIPVPLINSLEELATDTNLKPTTSSNTLLTTWFEEAARDTKPSIFKTFHNIFTENPSYYAKDLYDGGKRVLNGDSGFIERKEALEYLEALDFTATRKCRTMIAQKGFSPYITSIGFRDDFPYIKLFNNIMIRTLDFGLRSFWDTMYVPHSPCRPLEVVIAESPVLSNEAMMTAFLILAIGYGFALIAFLFELSIKPKN